MHNPSGFSGRIEKALNNVKQELFSFPKAFYKVWRQCRRLFFPFLLLIIPDLAAQDLPAWLLMENGILAFEERDFSSASHLFQEAGKKVSPLPEAEYWMGRLYEEEGEYILAEKQYERAIEGADWLYIPSQLYEMKYRLSHIYLNLSRYHEYETILLGMTEQEIRQNPEDIKREHNYLSVFLEDGLNRLLYLYRFNCTFSYQAMTELGIYYYKNGLYSSSIVYNLLALMNVFSTGINVLLDSDPFFEFPQNLDHLCKLDSDYVIESLNRNLDMNLEDPVLGTESERQKTIDSIRNKTPEDELSEFLYPSLYCVDNLTKDELIEEYLYNSSFFQTLYYLGNALYAKGYKERAYECWKLISDSNTSENRWRIMAEQQLISPEISGEESIY